MDKPRINELVVVEGKHDAQRVRRLFDCEVAVTRGLSLDESTLALVKQAAQGRGVVILTDADHPGEVIRRRLTALAPNARQAVIEKARSTGKRNVGVEFADDEAIRQALRQAATFGESRQTLSLSEYRASGLMGDCGRREKVCAHFRLPFSNNKTLFRRLNALGVDQAALREAVDE